MSRFAVIRAERISPARLVAYARHEDRSFGDLSHIDPTMTPLNEQIIGTHEDPRRAVEAYLELTGARIPKGNDRPYTELLLTASPEFFDDNPANARRFVEAAKAFLKNEFGDDCVHASWHRDEKTDHIHALVVPVVDEARRKEIVELRRPKREKAKAKKEEDRQEQELVEFFNGGVKPKVRPSRAIQRLGETDEAFAARKAANTQKRAEKAAGAVSATARKPRKVEGALVSHQQHPAFYGFRSYAGLQDRWSAAVKDLGLERGVKGSEANHKTKREWAQSMLHEASKAVREGKRHAAQFIGEAKIRVKGAMAALKHQADQQAAHEAQRLAELASLEKKAVGLAARAEAVLTITGRPFEAEAIREERKKMTRQSERQIQR